MYEISPYATFSVGAGPQPSRSVTAATLDYTLQFRTFGHSENEGLNPPPPPPCAGYPNRPARFRHKRCYHSNDGTIILLDQYYCFIIKINQYFKIIFRQCFVQKTRQ